MKKKTTKKSTTSAKKGEYVLQAFLAQVPFDGWTGDSYDAALKTVKVTRAEADKIFPDGLGDLATAFSDQIDANMQKNIGAERGFARMRVRDKITLAVRTRLELLTPHRECMRRLMIWYAKPQHVPQAIKRVMKTVDMIWVAAGDTSTDYNFYTKRILLAGVMKATLLFWLSDESGDQQATWDFLDRRIADVLKVDKGISLIKEFTPSELVDMVRDKIGKFA